MPRFEEDSFDDENEDYSALLGLEKLEKVLEPIIAQQDIGNYDYDQIEQVFDKFRQPFLEQIFPQFFCDNLLKNNVLTVHNLQRWKTKFQFNNDLNDPKHRENCYTDANQELYKILLKNILTDTKLFANFIDALRTDHWHDDLADMYLNEMNLLRFDQTDDMPTSKAQNPAPKKSSSRSISFESESSGKDIKPTSRFFNVPEEYPIYVERESKVEELLFVLKQLDKKNGWLILHGLGGSGKTTLAASTIKKLNDKQFPHGVFWIKIDNISGQQLKVKLDLLAEFVSTFYNPDEGARFRHEQMDNVRFQIAKHFQTFPRSLLILDDVWSEEVLSLFNFGVSVMVTTQDEGIIHPTRFPNIHKVSIKTSTAKDKDVWTMDESMKLFNKCFQESHLELINSIFPVVQNEHVQEILKSFNYIPYCIPLIFQYIEPLYQELQNSLRQTNEAFIREGNRELDEHWSILRKSITKCEQFHDKWIELSQRSINNLKPDLKERFLDFAIFCESVPSDVFETFWCSEQCSKLQVKNILSKLRQKSLIIQTYNYSADRSKKLSYTVHDLTHKFFLDMTNKSSDIQKRHESLVHKYLNNYCRLDNGEYNYSLLPKDGYIYHNLGYHLHQARMDELFDTIFLDLGFVIEKIQKTGPSDLLNDYQLYKNSFRNTKKLHDFRLFVASNSSNFLQDNCDLLQLALFQPEESYVYIEARSIIDSRRSAQKNSGKSLYFCWKNQATCGIEQMKKWISFQCKKSIDAAAISPDSKVVATINENNIELWNACSGEFLGTNSKHLADIRFCKFSADNQYLLTGDCDGKARLWNNKFLSSYEINSSPICGDDNHDIRMIHQERRRRSSGGNAVQSGEAQLNKAKNLSQYLSLDKIFEECKLKKDAKAELQEMRATTEFRCGDISYDNQWILIGDGAGFLNLWSVSQTKKVGKIFVMNCDGNVLNDENEFEIECCSFSKDGHFALAMHSNDVYVYQVFPGSDNVFELFRVLKHQVKCYNAIFFNDLDELFVISSSHSTHLFEWDLSIANELPNYSVKPTRRYSITVSECRDNCHVFSYVTISPDGSKIAAFEPTRNEIYFWDRLSSTLPSSLTPSISASTSMHYDSFSSSGDSVCSKADDLKTIACHSYFRSCSDVFILDFCVEKENSLFSASQSGEIVLWDLQKNNRRTSIIDLRKFAYSGKNDNLRLLSIDNAGYLRLYNTLSAIEDRDFLIALKRHLKELKTRCSKDVGKLLPKMKITSCDIDNMHIVFGTDNGDVFYFNTSSNIFLHEKLNPPWNDSIIDCIFLRTDSGSTSFVAFSESHLCLFTLCLSTQEITRRGSSLKDMNDSIILYDDPPAKGESFEMILKHHRKDWIIITTSSGRIFVLDYLNNKLKIVKVFSVREEKISCISFGIWKPDREIIIVATCNKHIFLRLIRPDEECMECEDLFATRDHFIQAQCTPRSLAYCDRRSVLYVGHDNGDIASIQWTLGRNSEWSIFSSNQKNFILDLVLCPESDILVSGSDSICVWKASTGQLLQSLMTQGKVYKLHVVCERAQPNSIPKMTISTVSDASCLYIFQTIS